MADMNKLMQIINALEANGTDVEGMLGSLLTPVPMPQQMPGDNGMQPVPMPQQMPSNSGMQPVPMGRPLTQEEQLMELRRRMAAGASNNEFMGREMPPFKPFEGPGPGAVIDDEQVRQMMENRNRMPMMRGGSTSDVELEMLKRMMRGMSPSSTPSMPDPKSNVNGILKLLGGM